jgi:hypothetical protein
MKIENVKQETMLKLGLKDEEDVSYITEELLLDYLAEAELVEKAGAPSIDEEGNKIIRGYTDYGHNLVFTKQFTYYSNGPTGPKYKCGNQKRWKWRNDRGDEFSPQAKCSGKDYWYKLYCPTC